MEWIVVGSFIALVVLILIVLGGLALAVHINDKYQYNIFGLWNMVIVVVLFLFFYAGLLFLHVNLYKTATENYKESLDWAVQGKYMDYHANFGARHPFRGDNRTIITLFQSMCDNPEKELTEAEFNNRYRYAIAAQNGLVPPDRNAYMARRNMLKIFTVFIGLCLTVGFWLYHTIRTRNPIWGLLAAVYQILWAHGLMFIIACIIQTVSSLFSRRHDGHSCERGYDYYR